MLISKLYICKKLTLYTHEEIINYFNINLSLLTVVTFIYN